MDENLAEEVRHRIGEALPDRLSVLTILEALLLSIVTITAAWSGYAAAKWSTESAYSYAESASAQTRANRAYTTAVELRNFDSSTFEAWFAAYVAGNEPAQAIAERRFRPEFELAFQAWQATNPETNPNAAPGPTFMTEYELVELEEARELDEYSEQRLSDGARAGATADDYIRTTVFLASVLFLIGISAHFPLRGVRYGLILLGVVLLMLALSELTQLPRPPF